MSARPVVRAAGSGWLAAGRSAGTGAGLALSGALRAAARLQGEGPPAARHFVSPQRSRMNKPAELLNYRPGQGTVRISHLALDSKPPNHAQPGPDFLDVARSSLALPRHDTTTPHHQPRRHARPPVDPLSAAPRAPACMTMAMSAQAQDHGPRWPGQPAAAHIPAAQRPHSAKQKAADLRRNRQNSLRRAKNSTEQLRARTRGGSSSTVRTDDGAQSRGAGGGRFAVGNVGSNGIIYLR